MALRSVLCSLDERGYLLVVDNPRIRGVANRGGVYWREAGRFCWIAQTDQAPEIVDLVEASQPTYG